MFAKDKQFVASYQYQSLTNCDKKGKSPPKWVVRITPKYYKISFDGCNSKEICTFVSK